MPVQGDDFGARACGLLTGYAHPDHAYDLRRDQNYLPPPVRDSPSSIEATSEKMKACNLDMYEIEQRAMHLWTFPRYFDHFQEV